MKKCQVCGTTISQGMQSCPVCGSKIENEKIKPIKVEEKKVERKDSKFTIKGLMRFGLAALVFAWLMYDVIVSQVGKPIDMEVYVYEWQSEDFEELKMENEAFAMEVLPYREQFVNFVTNRHIDNSMKEEYVISESHHKSAKLLVSTMMDNFDVDISVFKPFDERSWYLQMEVEQLHHLKNLPSEFIEVLAELSNLSEIDLNIMMQDYILHQNPDSIEKFIGSQQVTIKYIEDNPRFTDPDGLLSVSIGIN